MFKYLLIIAISSAVTACANQEIKDTSENFGWVDSNCLAIKNPNLTPNTSITIASTNKGEHFSKANIIKKTTTAENCQPLLDDRGTVNIDSGYSFYTTQSKTSDSSGIAIIHFKNKHHEYVYSECTTSEGVFFKVGESSKEIWRGYYYLGHDIESSC